MNLDMTMFRQTFFEETSDILADLEGLLLRLERTPQDSELLNTIFRCAHSIKGGSSTFGLTDIATFTHSLETLLDRLRNGQSQVDTGITLLLLQSLDQLKALLAVARGEQSEAPDAALLIAQIEELIASTGGHEEWDEDALRAEIAQILAAQDAADNANTANNSGNDATDGKKATDSKEATREHPNSQTLQSRQYRLHFVPAPDTLRRGLDPMRLLIRLAEIATDVQMQCDLSDLPPLADLDPETCYLGWTATFCAPPDFAQLHELSGSAMEGDSLTLEEVLQAGSTQQMHSPALPAAEPAANILPIFNAQKADPDAFALKPEASEHTMEPVNPLVPEALQSAPACSMQTTAETLSSASPIAALPASTRANVLAVPPSGGVPAPGKAATPPAMKADAQTLRVATDKVDKLINLVGELVINQSMLNEVVQNFSMAKLPRLREAVAEMERASRELQERVMAVRMLPIKNAFGRFPRLVHDLSMTCGKKVELKTSGEETELDKTVIEGIADPITHLVRNSVDHGMETPEERRAAGKPETGIVSLHAFHEGGSIVIEISDDGRGLNRDRILQKALERGLLSASDPVPSDETLYNFIFHPGFSTAATVTDVSGRGVGMDIVRQSVQGLGGTITLHSTPGKGTRFRIRLPLTMAILEGLSLSVGDEVYILPLTSIVESIRPRAEDVRQIAGSAEVVLVRDETLPVLRLYQVFGATPHFTNPAHALLVIVENDGHKVALLVDELIGQNQAVIKSLETNYRKVEGVAGATIMGDGRVALILDVPGLIKEAYDKSRSIAA